MDHRARAGSVVEHDHSFSGLIEMRQDFPIILMAFDRPAYFEPVARSLAAQVDANLKGRTIALFQDGAVNQFSGKRRARDEDIRASIEIFRRYFPDGKIFAADSNLGVALSFERAERYAFEELNADAALFFEDDLILSPHYVNVLDRLTEMSLGDPRIGYVAAYGIQGPTAAQQNQQPLGYRVLGHLWGFGLTKRVWSNNRPFVDPYLKLLRNIDYRERDARAIHRLFKSWGVGFPGTSQDCIKHLACVLNDTVNLNISRNLAKYIGATGLHMTEAVFQMLALNQIEIQPPPLEALPPLDDQTLEHIKIIHWRWARSGASPFPPEHALPGHELWNFAIRMLAIPDVEPALMTLQDRFDLSISILMFCCWHGQQGHRLSRPELLASISHMEVWDRDVLGRMRMIRRTMSSDVSFQESGPASMPYSRSVAGLEQEAVKIGLAQLQKWPVTSSAGLPCVRTNIEEYLSVAGVVPDNLGNIDVLVAASETLSA